MKDCEENAYLWPNETWHGGQSFHFALDLSYLDCVSSSFVTSAGRAKTDGSRTGTRIWQKSFLLGLAMLELTAAGGLVDMAAKVM